MATSDMEFSPVENAIAEAVAGIRGDEVDAVDGEFAVENAGIELGDDGMDAAASGVGAVLAPRGAQPKFLPPTMILLGRHEIVVGLGKVTCPCFLTLFFV